MSDEGRDHEGVEPRLVDHPAWGGAVGVFSTRDALAGSLVMLLPGELVGRPDRYSLQLDRDVHLRGNGSLWEELRHSCEPNAWVDSSSPLARVRALRYVRAEEEITIDYCATEEALCYPFACSCGSARCYGDVRGYRCLLPGERARIGGWASPWLLREYAAAP